MSTNPVSSEKRRPKRKSKNSRFLRNSKGFAKQGIYGRGTQIADDQYRYFISILDAFKNGFEDIEDKTNMARNVFEQTKTQEVFMASNQIVCKVLESLVGFVDDKNLEHYFTVFMEDIRVICADSFASHVLQKLVEIAFLRCMGYQNNVKLETTEKKDDKSIKVDILSEQYYNTMTIFTEEHRFKCQEFVQRVGKFLLNNLEELVWESYANHIIRTCIFCLAGLHVPKVAFTKHNFDLTKNSTIYKVPDEWKTIMMEFSQRLELWPQFTDFPYNEHQSALLGVICMALRVVDKNILKHFGKQILHKTFLQTDDCIELDEPEQKRVATDKTKATVPAKDLPKVFRYQTSVMLLETLLSVAGRKMLKELNALLFRGRMLVLAQDPLTNFAVQRLLQHFNEREEFDILFQELAECIESLISLGHTGIVEALSAGCLRLGTKQSQMFGIIQNALHLPSTNDKERNRLFLKCLLKLKPYDETLKDNTLNFNSNSSVHLHGSLIVQHLLQYNKPIFLVNCILEMPAGELLGIFNTPNGSHIADSFLSSKFISEKSYEKLIRHLEGFYVDLAVSKHGSRVIERFFASAREPQKVNIAKELNQSASMLRGSPFGRLIYNKLAIETFRLSATQWRASLKPKEN